MIIRIVKMTFQEDKVQDFIDIYDEVKLNIADFDGCQHLELLKDTENSNVFMTYSHWESVDHLNVYRNSKLFTETWEQTKQLFSDSPEVNSMRHLG